MPAIVDYRFLLHQKTYVVWLAGINRYIQMQEPAFAVFQLWAQGNDKETIAKACTQKYGLPPGEAFRFTEEITGPIEALYGPLHTETRLPPPAITFPLLSDYHSVRAYHIGMRDYIFCYCSRYIEELFHPMIRHHETGEALPGQADRFEIVHDGDNFAFRVNAAETFYYSEDEKGHFMGAVCVELLNKIHGKHVSDWVGILHASAVTDGTGALIFSASSGQGKSTLATLMMANGFTFLSDDFVPVAFSTPEIYPFPLGISVKKGAIPILSEYFPALALPGTGNQDQNENSEKYLPAAGETELPANVAAAAIVLVQYDPATEYDFRRVSNLKVMNEIIRDSWIANNPEAAVRFMEWYFTLPVYSLRYSDNKKAVSRLKKLFGNG